MSVHVVKGVFMYVKKTVVLNTLVIMTSVSDVEYSKN